MSSDPPAYEPPGPEITGGDTEAADAGADNNKSRGADTFKDEPAQGDYDDEGDPVKWNFSPLTIIILVILNLLALGAVGYLIWYAVDQATNTNAPTPSPTIATPPPTLAPSRSMRPSLVPSVAGAPAIEPSQSPSIDSTPAPTASSQPTPIASDSPTFGSFMCNLCGEGKTMSTASLTDTVSFGTRVTRTCQELLTDQNNGDILEEQCIALYDDIVATCGCDSTATIGARDDAAITALIEAEGIDTTVSDTNEALALAVLLDTTTDTYFAGAKATATDAEVLQRYILILAYYQLHAEADLTNTGLYSISECSWTSVVTCEYGQVSTVYFSALVETPASGDPIFPTDLFWLEYVQSIRVNDYAFASAMPTDFESPDLLTALDLTGNSFTGTLPDELFELRSLTSLDLSNNGLDGNLGDKSKIKQLIRLTNLNLGTNAFVGTIPTCELSTTPTTLITDCASEVTCTCCSSCADSTAGTV